MRPVLIWLAAFLAGNATAAEVTFNGLTLRVDDGTGALVYMSYPATGVILSASPKSGGLVDVAYPVDTFPPLRLATQHSRARVSRTPSELAIRWEQLSGSRAGIVLP